MVEKARKMKPDVGARTYNNDRRRIHRSVEEISVPRPLLASTLESGSDRIAPRDLEVRASPSLKDFPCTFVPSSNPSLRHVLIEAVSVTGQQVPGCDSPVEGL